MENFIIFANRFVMVREQKYKAIVHFVEEQIVSGNYRIGDKIPSANSFKIRFGISRSSVFLALDELKSRGLIEAEPAIGYYVASDQVKIKEKVLLLFNEFTAFKENIYNAFMAEIGDAAIVDIVFHNYNRAVFETLLRGANGKYTSYILMPGKFTGIEGILSAVSGHVILADHFDRKLIGRYSSVGQDFEEDTYRALSTGLDKIRKYRRIILIQKSEKEPGERYCGIQRFCSENGFLSMLVPSVDGFEIRKGDLFITPEDRELVELLKKTTQMNMTSGIEFGVISYNDDSIKEILDGGISTLSTDFALMGRTLAGLVKDKSLHTVANPCKLTIRKSI